jgi:hypothetical protein
MALRIEAWLGVERGSEARLWIAEQSAYDSGKQNNVSRPLRYMCNQPHLNG